MTTSNRETAMFWLAHMRSQLAALAENAEHGGQGDDADLDEQDDPLRGIHIPGSTLGR